MIFTLCYAYATIMQWWRLRSLRNKLNGTLNEQNALLVCSGQTVHDSRKHRSLENLLFRTDNRIACTVVPKQKLNLSQWIAFPKNLRYFPIYIDDNKVLVSEGSIFIVLQAVLESYTKHQGEIVQVENFGELVGWKATDSFEVVVKTDLDNLTKLINQFAQTDIDINHELKLLKIETVDVEGAATVIKYEKKYLKEQTLKYSYASVHWNRFVADIKELYAKIRDITNPKIKIENGSTKCFEAVPKIVKKEPKKNAEEKKSLDVKKEAKKATEDKNTLDVSTGGDHRRHKHAEHNKTQAKSEKKNRDVGNKAKAETKGKHKTKNPEEKSEAPKVQAKKEHKRAANKLVKQSSVKDNEIEVKVDRVVDSAVSPSSSMNSATVKPPNVLVYADSLITKDNVKRVLYSILNKEKYTIYDLPTTSKHTVWDKSTVLVVKQFSKDSDQSNHSSNGSSPLAPRTPSNVELRHNDRDYNIQVQVLGTEETWQTPSLLLAKVKLSQGRAVFSQVHLEIDPDEYENDEDKYRSLLSSNEARLEILKDILSNHLDMVCDENFGNVDYSPGYFLGRYD
ncbi:biotin--protein ligase, partial [Asbolus verrucosus]